MKCPEHLKFEPIKLPNPRVVGVKKLYLFKTCMYVVNVPASSGGVKLSQPKPSSQSTPSQQKSSSQVKQEDDDDLDELTMDEIDQSMIGIEES